MLEEEALYPRLAAASGALNSGQDIGTTLGKAEAFCGHEPGIAPTSKHASPAAPANVSVEQPKGP